ncbi:MAG: YfcE family phosphodiesterase, partial [Chitinivibrionales bacterium]|nr:YfcE family phosphodiesterase [Chitinivibrionales bacterium]
MLLVVSDTHGLLRPEVLELARKCELVIHAGDIGAVDVLQRLREVAEVVAVRGNVDHGAWAHELPRHARVERHGTTLYVVHQPEHLDVNPVTAGIDVVISGHSHRPSVRREGDVLYLNPGSAGPRRFHLPATVALLEVAENALPEARTVGLDGE